MIFWAGATAAASGPRLGERVLDVCEASQHTGPSRAVVRRAARMGRVKTRTLIILAVVTAALILAAGIVQIVLGRLTSP